VHDEARGLQLAEIVLEGLKGWPQQKRTGPRALQLAIAMDDVARRYSRDKRYHGAEVACFDALSIASAAGDKALAGGDYASEKE
jgi:hypothetical protein